jgi:hypothetical protein
MKERERERETSRYIYDISASVSLECVSHIADFSLERLCCCRA